MSDPKRFKASDICAAMAKRWCAPEWAIMWEVNEGTGYQTGRKADAVMMSLWPSRGLELHGVEIKVSRADWKREAADPTKAEAIAAFCDRWWIHTPRGIITDLSELPPAWGLREFDGKVWRTIREAEKTEAKPITRTFLAALLRRADEMHRAFASESVREAREAGYAEIEKARARITQQVEEQVKRRTANLEEAAKNVAAFEAAFGKGSAVSWQADPVAWGRAARALADLNTGFGPIVARLRAAADEIEALQSIAGKDAA